MLAIFHKKYIMNTMVPINICIFEVIAIDLFGAPTQTEWETAPQEHTRYSVFHSFLYDIRKFIFF